MGVVNTDVIGTEAGVGSVSGTYALQNGSGNGRVLLAVATAGDGQVTTRTLSLEFDSGGTPTAMTQAALAGEDASNHAVAGIWGLFDSQLPASPGSYTVTVTSNDSSTDVISLAVIEFDQMNQSITDTATQTAFGKTASLSPTSPGNFLVSAIHANNQGSTSPTLTLSGSATSVMNINNSNAGWSFTRNQAAGAAYAAGASTIGWSVSLDAANEAHAVVSLTSAAAGTTIPVFMHHLRQQGIS